MKKFCCFVAIAVCLGFAGVAHASSIDFAINILDPLPLPRAPWASLLYIRTPLM